MMQRGGEIRGEVVKDVRRNTLLPILHRNIDFGAQMYTDSLHSYHTLGQFYRAHEIVNHAFEYVRGNAHVNNVECFWAVLKRGLTGTYVCPSPEHLERYLDEHIFRFNSRKDLDAVRFKKAAALVEGKRIMYKDLIFGLRPGRKIKNEA